MIDRKTAKICAVLIALMLVAAMWRITLPDDWTTLAVQGRPKLPSLLLFVFPAASALVAGVLYWTGLRAKADLAKQPWYKWGAFISISYCGGIRSVHGRCSSALRPPTSIITVELTIAPRPFRTGYQ